MKKEIRRFDKIWLCLGLVAALGKVASLKLGKREVGIITLQVIARCLNTTMETLLRDL
jgi:hypothetical protein